MNKIKWMGIVAAISMVAMVGCKPKSATEPTATTPGAAEKAGAVLDNAADKTVEGTGVAMEKAGEVMKNAGASMEETGANMQK
ncbi:MAG: hypothetical protein PHP44_11835 [Kiritimatiellae bacterium]|nr:hypothetical protein [Kiritimatiellia bacterium]